MSSNAKGRPFPGRPFHCQPKPTEILAEAVPRDGGNA